MPPKREAATELAGQMVQVLEAQRRLGADSYPLTLRRLAELTDPGAPPELVQKAVGKKKPFGERTLAIKPKDLDSPVALAEDWEQLAGSPLLLDYVLQSVCTPSRPTCDVSKLKGKIPARLKDVFEAAVNRRLQENRLPPGVAVVVVKKKNHLHLLRYPLPRPPEVALAERLVEVLRSQRQLGASAYPTRFARLEELTGAVGDPALEKATKQAPFKDGVLVAIPKRPDAPVALVEDLEQLADSRLLLESALEATRSDSTQIFAPSALCKKVVAPLKKPLEASIRRRTESRALPPTVGCLRQKNKPLLFLMRDVVEPPPGRESVPPAFLPARPALEPRGMPAVHSGREEPGEVHEHPQRKEALAAQALPPPGPGGPPSDFARAFDDAFQRLDAQKGLHNFVSLVELRGSLPFDRQTFDAQLNHLRRAGRYTLSGAEGRHGLSPEEKGAGIEEDGATLLYVSRKSS